MEQYWIWLSCVDGIGPKRFYRLLSVYEDARNVWDNVGDEGMRFLGARTLANLRAARTQEFFYRLFARLQSGGMRALSRICDDYPAALSQIYDPPPTLFVRGEANLSAERMFAVVGSRRATREGKRAAREFCVALAREGVCVVSGLARGVDTCAHLGTLEGGGVTIAVLGSGADVIYPAENEALAEPDRRRGRRDRLGVRAGARPAQGNFPGAQPHHQRAFAGRSVGGGNQNLRGVITVSLAAEQGRDVFALPGSIYSPLSEAGNRLILEGAYPALSAWDILEHYRWASRPDMRSVKRAAPELDEEEAPIYQALRAQEMTFDELMAEVKIPAPKLNSLLTMLELRGIIVKAPGGIYRAYQ